MNRINNLTQWRDFLIIYKRFAKINKQPRDSCKTSDNLLKTKLISVYLLYIDILLTYIVYKTILLLLIYTLKLDIINRKSGLLCHRFSCFFKLETNNNTLCKYTSYVNLSYWCRKSITIFPIKIVLKKFHIVYF